MQHERAVAKAPPSKKPVLGPYSENVKEEMRAYHKRHVAYESKKLYSVLLDAADNHVPEDVILEVVKELEDKPWFGFAYLRAVILKRAEERAGRTFTQSGPSQVL